MRVDRILVCVDGSGGSFGAARAAIDLALQTRARLEAVAVVDSRRLPGDSRSAAAAQREADALAALDRVARMAAEQGLEAQVQLRAGTVFEEVLDEARSTRADLIVMGRTGRHGPGSGLMGSSALGVAEFTEVPVLLVPAAP